MSLARNIAVLTCLIALPLADVRAQGPTRERSGIAIALSPEAVSDDTVLYLDQIAKLTGGSISLRQRLARLDVAEFKLGAKGTAVSAKQVRFRLLLAGISADAFHMAGAPRTLVRASDEPISARKVMAAADDVLRTRYPSAGGPRDVMLPLIELRREDRVQFDAKLASGGARNGVVRVNVIVVINGQPREVVPVSFELNEYRSASRQTLDGIFRTPPSSEAPPKKEAVIKNRDLVRVIAVVGAAQVVATGEAQQDGRVGEIIRVRNVESNRTVNARVESAGVVLVEY